MLTKKSLIVGVVIFTVGAAYLLGLGEYLNLVSLKEKSSGFTDYYAANPWQTSFWFFLIYIVSTAISIPGASILTLAGGAVFGLWWGVVLVSFASTIGASLAFLLSRYVLKEIFNHICSF